MPLKPASSRDHRRLLHSTRIIPILKLVWYNAGAIASTFVNFLFVPGALIICLESVASRTELVDGLIQEELFQCPFLEVGAFGIFQLANVLNSAL